MQTVDSLSNEHAQCTAQTDRYTQTKGMRTDELLAEKLHLPHHHPSLTHHPTPPLTPQVVLPLKSPSFGQHPRTKDGCLIIQDKASCFPSQLLMDAWTGGDVIDACAAPGNKTSHAGE